LSKKLKKRILEACGFSNLSREERFFLAKELHESTDLKQEICNEIDGVSFRDIEKAISDFLVEQKPSKTKRAKTTHPKQAKLDSFEETELQPERSFTKLRVEYLLNLQEVNLLLSASEEPLADHKRQVESDYPTYDQSETLKLLEGK
jgi:hypothetical protein